jgi:hypothetical protein
MGYTFRFLKPTHPYYPAWQEYRRRRRVGLLSFGGIIAFVALGQSIAIPVGNWLETDVPQQVIVAAFCFLGLPLLLFRTYQWLSWPCPRCGKAFHWKLGHRRVSWVINGCLHCGLEEYAPCEPSEQLWEFERSDPSSK